MKDMETKTETDMSTENHRKVMITTSRFLGYDKNEYGDLIVNRKEAEIVSLTFDLYLLNVAHQGLGNCLITWV